MARKTKRRPYRRPSPPQRREDAAERQRQLESVARELLSSSTLEQLRQTLTERESLLAQADQAAQLDPNPTNLARYRFAVSECEAVRAALRLADGR